MARFLTPIKRCAELTTFDHLELSDTCQELVSTLMLVHVRVVSLQSNVQKILETCLRTTVHRSCAREVLHNYVFACVRIEERIKASTTKWVVNICPKVVQQRTAPPTICLLFVARSSAIGSWRHEGKHSERLVSKWLLAKWMVYHFHGQCSKSLALKLINADQV